MATRKTAAAKKRAQKKAVTNENVEAEVHEPDETNLLESEDSTSDDAPGDQATDDYGSENATDSDSAATSAVDEANTHESDESPSESLTEGSGGIHTASLRSQPANDSEWVTDEHGNTLVEPGTKTALHPVTQRRFWPFSYEHVDETHIRATTNVEHVNKHYGKTTRWGSGLAYAAGKVLHSTILDYVIDKDTHKAPVDED